MPLLFSYHISGGNMSISYKELLSGHTLSEIPINHQHNLEQLLVCINKLRNAWGKPMIVTSGYRLMQDHLRIYSQIASKKGIDFDASKVPMGSNHLKGLAVDFADSDGSLYLWANNNQDKLKEWGIWCEKDTKGWLHCQCVPYGSYKEGKSRFFNP
jgi:hypothetical protein